jgi:hypothetical protein
MTEGQRITYSDEEVRSFLPSGWALADRSTGEDGTAGEWDAKKRAWKIGVIDNVEFEYPVVVKAAELSDGGRIEALKRAMNRVFRERLG